MPKKTAQDKQHSGVYVVAVDFDGTLCVNNWPKIGAPRIKVIEKAKTCRCDGVKVVLWTCRTGDKLRDAVEWCASFGLYFDAVNENVPEMLEVFGGDCRKIFANEYWDDRAVPLTKLLR